MYAKMLMKVWPIFLLIQTGWCQKEDKDWGEWDFLQFKFAFAFAAMRQLRPVT